MREITPCYIAVLHFGVCCVKVSFDAISITPFVLILKIFINRMLYCIPKPSLEINSVTATAKIAEVRP